MDVVSTLFWFIFHNTQKKIHNYRTAPLGYVVFLLI